MRHGLAVTGAGRQGATKPAVRLAPRQAGLSRCDDNAPPRRGLNQLHRRQDAATFGRRWSEALRRGWRRARKKVVIGDVASWIWNLSHEYFPGARSTPWLSRDLHRYAYTSHNDHASTSCTRSSSRYAVLSDGSSPRQRAEFRRQLPEFASVMGWIGRSASVYRLLVRQRNPQRIEDFCLAGVGNRQPCDAGLLIHSIFQ